ncbi:baseplate multidomain protein megatron [Pseudoponticoccus marisrubri]|uniref:Host specificity protein n=1 Tax=Pseudoponticoccus marisrubri TaxID=1685382 RepID=A0A0W7WN61_9RHOB|nr:glycoside hydrolase/phage tail family protein [Pseudoponticoccus marisrubri]KUF11928.1 host specificity protein [Pseudoponticoccus marisrubri]
MATILLSAAGAAIGSSIGGSFLGLSMMAVGRFVGASVGRAIDQRLMGQGSETVETGKIERFRLTGAGEGAPIAQVYGRMRVGGHVIWSTEFREHVKTRGGGGKGAPSQPEVKTYSYSVSLALALCEGEITGVHRVWADGAEIPLSDLNMRVHYGTPDQLPDPKMEAVEGVGLVPAYRGTAYVVIEDLRLKAYGNRVPQFSFEVTRPDLSEADVPALVEGVAMIPGTGEYALSTSTVYSGTTNIGTLVFAPDLAKKKVENVNTPGELPDFEVSLNHLTEEAPNCRAVSLVVSWFGDDLRCDRCTIRPKVEQTEFDATKEKHRWSVSGLTRAEAQTVPREADRPVYGGTPSDASVIQAIRRMSEQGLEVLYYPFILMDQMPGNGRTDPWTGAEDQPKLPWRGHITTSVAPGREDSPDGTQAAEAEVAAFFGTATAADFGIGNKSVSYSGPEEWSFSRFILHQAALCAVAGNVTAFCIGTEMRSLTQIRGAAGFPAVLALRALAAECRALLGPEVKIGYAADWSEYFGYHPQDGSGDLYFHLDPLWADDEIDFIGIDNYMPLSDWREGTEHADAHWGAIYNPDYLRANIEGGEGYDWYYETPEARDAQRRDPITDDAHGEPWVWRYKDIRNWWQNRHFERIGGVRQKLPTDWQPQSKPVWFTELGCAAVDKGTNQPNKFLDPKSSESQLPHYSNGLRDELIQRHYLQAVLGYWGDPGVNPVSEVYGGPMLDMSRAFVWAWDARPYPWFPGNDALWSDGPNYRRGHWLNGRISHRSLASVVREICARVGLTEIDTSQLLGTVKGYLVPHVGDARQALQPLMLAHGFDAIERDGKLVFRMRDGRQAIDVSPDTLAVSDEIEGALAETRAGEAEMSGRVRVGFFQADSDHQVASEEAVLPDHETHAVSASDLSMVLTRAEGRQTAERWLAEARVARDTMRFALPPSQLALGAGDVVRLPAKSGPVLARIDKVEVMEHQVIDAVRIEPDVFRPSEFPEDAAALRPFTPAVPVTPFFMDLPLMTGEEVPHAPHLALTAEPWPGSVAVYDAAEDADYALNEIIAAESVVGVTETPLFAAPAGRIDRGAPLEVRLLDGALQSISDAGLLNGGNLMAIGDGSSDRWELFQFRDAAPLLDNRWLLSHRLRGQAGSDALMPEVWPAGSVVVLMNGAPTQIGLAAAQRRLARHYRIGPARRPIDDPSYVHTVQAFDGNGLRPYSPVHLRATPQGGGWQIGWIRRTRIDGDSWDLAEVPLGEARERYLVRVMQSETVIREAEVSTPGWTYTGAMVSDDGLSGAFEITVAQLSERYGPGLFARLPLSA